MCMWKRRHQLMDAQYVPPNLGTSCDGATTHTPACVQVLGLHVIEGAAFAANLSDGMMVATFNNQQLTVSIAANGSVSFTGPDGGTTATVTEADIVSCKGVIHILDALILPGVDVNASAPEMPPVPDNCSSLAEILESEPDLASLLLAVEVRCSLRCAMLHQEQCTGAMHAISTSSTPGINAQCVH
jgi:hypothetical protein